MTPSEQNGPYLLFLIHRSDALICSSDLEETNLAEFGSALEKERRKEEGALETAWGEGTGVGSEEGLWVWRIENFQVVPAPKKKYGSFFNGDSYIILKVSTKAYADTHHRHHTDREGGRIDMLHLNTLVLQETKH